MLCKVLGTIGRSVSGRVFNIQTDQYKRHIAVLVGIIHAYVHVLYIPTSILVTCNVCADFSCVFSVHVPEWRKYY